MPAQTIGEVITQLEKIIADAIASGSRAGYFAALYYKVTCRVNQGIATGEFQNGPRMEQLDVTFANRYLAAYEQWAAKQSAAVSLSWKVALRCWIRLRY
jgi:hypothetical protein